VTLNDFELAEAIIIGQIQARITDDDYAAIGKRKGCKIV